jgi:hypothetical protein
MEATSTGTILPGAGTGRPDTDGSEAAKPASSLAAVLRRLLPRAIRLCVHCRENPAGYWVSHRGDRTVRRPWCVSCSHGLDWRDCDVIPFG